MTPDGRQHDLCRRDTIAGEARFSAGDSERAVKLLSDVRIAATSGPERAGVLWRLARVRYHHDDIAASRQLLEEADQEAGDDLALRAAIERDLSYPAFALTELHTMQRHADAAAELAERVGAPHVLADPLGLSAVAQFLLGQGMRLDLDSSSPRRLEDWGQPRPSFSVRPQPSPASSPGRAGSTGPRPSPRGRTRTNRAGRRQRSAVPLAPACEFDCWTGELERGHARVSTWIASPSRPARRESGPSHAARRRCWQLISDWSTRRARCPPWRWGGHGHRTPRGRSEHGCPRASSNRRSATPIRPARGSGPVIAIAGAGLRGTGCSVVAGGSDRSACPRGRTRPGEGLD